MSIYKSKYKGEQIDGLLDFVDTNKDNIAMQSDIPTVPNDISDFNNDSGFIDNTVNNLINYYLKTETYTKDEINTLISTATSGGFIKVNELPTENINIKAIYLVPYTGSRAKNLYEEYIYIDGDWEMIGTTKIDLSNYVTTEALNTALANYVLTTNLTLLLNAKQDKMQFETMPTASADYLEKIIQYTGLTTDTYHHGRFYECVTDGTNYSWEEQEAGVSNFNDLTNRPQKEVTSIQSLIDPVPIPPHNQTLDYSTEEQVVGKWIDGKPLYQKTIYTTTPSKKENWNYIASLGETCKIVNYSGCLIRRTGYGDVPIVFASGGFYILFNDQWVNNVHVKESYGYINLYVGDENALGTPFSITVQYTKTTD